MKGIILAGGKASRLYPVTKEICKQLLPIYNKPLIYYPLSVLMLAGIRDILIISTPRDIPRFKNLLGDGKDLGINLFYAVQQEPKGIAEAFIIGEDFISHTQKGTSTRKGTSDNVCLILGDNIFYGHKLIELLKEASFLKEGAIIFGCYVKDPQRYGVIEFDKKRKAISIQEKPDEPKSNWVVTGLYFYDNNVIDISKKLKPSGRGELEISDINNEYLKREKLEVKLLGRGYAWLDTGTYDSLIDASIFIKTIEERQGLKIGCIEEAAYRMGYINKEQVKKIAKGINTSYGEYLREMLKDEK